MREEDHELQKMLDDAHTFAEGQHGEACDGHSPVENEFKAMGLSVGLNDHQEGVLQWSSGNKKSYFPCGKTYDKLSPGVYEIVQSEAGLFFEKILVRTEGLLRFPQTNSESVIEEIKTFWSKEDCFREYDIAYKRGIMLWGPPGSGKSCTIQLITKDVIDRGGVVIKFTHPGTFMMGMRLFRAIQPNTPIVVLMEDIDSIILSFNESSVLNILDGVDRVEKTVFLATTNYPERLGARIINRPSRFDKRFKIDHPDEESRELYFKHLIGDRDVVELKGKLSQWVEDTEGFSLAHLKELFVAVVILGDDYNEAIETLSSMKEQCISDKEFDSVQSIGFGNLKTARRKR